MFCKTQTPIFREIFQIEQKLLQNFSNINERKTFQLFRAKNVLNEIQASKHRKRLKSVFKRD